MKSFLKSPILRNTVKITFVLGLLYYLAQRGFLSLDATKNAFTRMDHIIPAVLSMLVTNVLTIWRWQLLLKAQGIYLALSRTIQLTLIGNFFNIALPGAVSGDVVKAIYVAKEAPGKRANALSSILFDRVAGVSALVLVSVGALLLSLNEPWAGDQLKTLPSMILFFGFGVVVFFGYLFVVKEDRDPLLILFKKLEEKINAFGSIVRVYQGIRVYHTDKATVIKTLLISIAIHLFVVYAYVHFTHAIGEEHLPSLALFVIAPLGLIVTAIPIMPAGVGHGHLAFSYLFLLLGSERGADIFNLFVLYQLTLGGIGGLVYLRFKSDIPLATEEQTNGTKLA